MKKNLIFVAVALICLSIFAWWYYQPKRVIERRLLSFIDTMQIDSGSGKTARIMKGNRISSYFTHEVELETPFDEANGKMTRNDISSGYSYAAEMASSIKIEADDDISVTVNGDSAEVSFHCQAEAAIGRWVKPVNGKYHTRIWWEKSDEGWRIKKLQCQEAP